MKTSNIILALIALNSACKNSKTQSDEQPKTPLGANQAKIQPIFNLPSGTTNIQIGQGFNTLAGIAGSDELTKSCVTFDPQSLSTLAGAEGSNLKVSLSFVGSTSEMFSKLNSNAELGLGIKRADFTAAASANVTGLRERTLKSENSYALVEVSKIFQNRSLSNYKINTDVLTYFKTEKDPNGFFQKCGDSFVSGVTLGAQVFALIECENQTSQDKDANDQLLKGSTGVFGLSAQGESKSVFEKIVTESNSKCGIFIEARGGKGSIATSVKEFNDSMLNYVVQSEIKDSVPINISTTPYSQILDREFNDSVLAHATLSFPGRSAFLKMLRGDLTSLRSLYLKDSTAKLLETVNKYEGILLACSLKPYDDQACAVPLANPAFVGFKPKLPNL